MLNWFSLRVRLQEMVEHMQQGQDVLFIAVSLGKATTRLVALRGRGMARNLHPPEIRDRALSY